MRTRFKKLILAMMLAISLPSFAYDFKVDGIYYNILSSTKKTVEVTYDGSYENHYSHEYYGSVTIPETVTYSGKTYSVTSIRVGAFYDCSYLTEVTIPNSVTSIGNRAFYGCSGLTEVTIPNSVTEIGNGAFYNCTKLYQVINLSKLSLTKGSANHGYVAYYASIVINAPNGIINGDFIWSISEVDDVNILARYLGAASKLILPDDYNGENYVIGNDAFYACSSLTSVTIPNTVTSIGNYAFSYCSGLTSVTIPNSVTSIGNSAFSYCTGLKSVTIPNSVTSIGNYAFSYCTGLKSVTIPNSVTSIGNYAFRDCSGLTSVTIPNSVTSIGNSAFSYCTGLTSISVESGNSNYDSRDKCNAIIETETNTLITGCQNTVIPNSVTSIGSSAFYNCSGLTSVTIPNSVTSIGNSAFYGCRSLTSITIPNTITSIGESAFRDCSGLTEVNYIAENCTSMGSYDYPVFKDCTNLKIVNIGNLVKSIPHYAFIGCSGLKSIEIPNSVTSIGNSAFRDCTGLTVVTIPNSVTSIGQYAFYNCSGLTEVTIGNSVTSIGERAFDDCTGLTEVTIPNSVTSIGERAFFGCTGLIEVNFNAEGCTKMGSYDYPVFKDCTNLKTINIGNLVKSIPHYAFRGCSGLTSITIPNSVTSIGERAFEGCSGLTSVTIPNSVTEIGDYAFRGCSGLTEVNYNAENCTSMGSYDYTVFKDCTNLKTVNIGNLVKSIPHYAFRGCYGLKSVTISNSVTSIGKSAFEGCSGLTSVTIPNSVTSIGNSAFEGCSGLTEVTIGNSVTSIKDVFGGCKKITKLVIADGTETLSLGNSFTDCPFVKLYLGRDYSYNTTDSPFSNKKTLKEITIGNSITSIREKEFLNCIGLTSLTIGTGVLSIGTNAFSYYDNNNYSNLDIKKVIWLTNTPPQGYETVAGEVNYVANNRYSDLSNVTIYPYLSSLFEVDGIKYVPVSPSERTSDALDCSYETSISDINIGKTVSFKGIEMKIKAVKPYTFYDNTNITKATIDSEFNGSIGDYAFAYCNKIDEIILPDGVTSLGGSAFEGCSSLASVKIGSGIPALNDNAFYGCTPLSKITIPANVTSIGNNVFGNCSSLEELKIIDRDTELSLGSNGSNPLFSDCPLKSVYIGGNISYPTSSDYGYSPFYRNTSLETVVITDKETEISENEFYGCTALKTVYMGDGVKTIGDWAFSGCSSLDSFSFGTGMKTIGTEAFSDCTAMTKLYSKAIVPPTCGTQALDDINKWNCELYVPQASITKYQIVDQWKEFFFIKDIESGIEDVYVEEVAVTVEDGKIVVKNVTGIVTIYNLTGIAVANEIADGNEVRFDNLQPGVYIVVVNNKSVKVVL